MTLKELTDMRQWLQSLLNIVEKEIKLKTMDPRKD